LYCRCFSPQSTLR